MSDQPSIKNQSGWVKQLSRFASVGVLATLVHTVVALALIRFYQFSSTESNVGAFLVAMIFSYSLNSIWSFEKSMEMASFVRFAVVSVVNLGLIVVVSQINDQLGFPSEVSVLLIAVMMPMINFIIHKFWTFNERGSDDLQN